MNDNMYRQLLEEKWSTKPGKILPTWRRPSPLLEGGVNVLARPSDEKNNPSMKDEFSIHNGQFPSRLDEIVCSDLVWDALLI